MRVVATIEADLEVTPLGTRSRLATELGGVPVLRRTVERVRLAKRISEVHVLCPSAQHERCSAILEGTRATVHPHEADQPPWRLLVQTARKWSLDGWRGGVGGTCSFDEFVDPRLIGGLLTSIDADAVMSVPAAAALVDPELADRIIDCHRDSGDDIRLTFTQAAPGLAGILLDASLVRELFEQNVPIGWLFSYKPDNPQKDLALQSCCLEIPADVRYAVGRLTADTRRSTERIASLLREHDAPDLVTIGRWLRRREATTVEPMPLEVEIELSTDDPYPDALLGPRGSRVQARGPIDPDLVEQVVTELVRYDDALVVLGGFGDPLRHPRFGQILEAVRSVRRNGHGLYGLAIRTTGVDLDDESIEAIVSNDVDILEVTLDAWTPQLYRELQSPGKSAGADLETVLNRLDRLNELRQRRETVKPLVVPQMTKARDNVQELDDFHDGWLRRVGAVAISGYSHRARQCDDHSVIPMAPSPRVGCRRIRSRCMVLADGRLVLCDQDFNGLHVVGRVGEQSLEALWLGAAFQRVRDTHCQGRFDPTPLCAACEEWHRP